MPWSASSKRWAIRFLPPPRSEATISPPSPLSHGERGTRDDRFPRSLMVAGWHVQQATKAKGKQYMTDQQSARPRVLVADPIAAEGAEILRSFAEVDER